MSLCHCRTAEWHFFVLIIILKKGNLKMPKTKSQKLFFTALTAWIMVYIMTLYNMVIAENEFTNQTFLLALKGMWAEYIIIFLAALFISSPIASKLAFKVVKNGDRPIFIIFTIQIFTVICQVAIASIIGVFHSYGFTTNFIPNYISVYCVNFIMALPVQLIIAGPIARFVFRKIFCRN